MVNSFDDFTPGDALRLAVTEAGGQTQLAAICGCTQGAIWQMLQKPDPMLSVRFVLRVEDALGIPRHILRPDIYPRQPEPALAEAR